MKKTMHLSFCLVLLLILSCAASYAEAGGVDEQAVFNISPSIMVPTIKGDKEKFEEDNWLSRNATGGINEFKYFKNISGTDTLDMNGRALAGNNDYAFEGEFIRDGIGSIVLEFEKFRKYYDGTGGWQSVLPSALSAYYPRVAELDRDLYLDIGNFGIKGVLKAEGYPVVNLSYEREHKEGAKSLTSWSSVTSTGYNAPKSYPTALDLDEISDTFKLGISGEIKKVKASLDQTIEHVALETGKLNNVTVGSNGSISSIRSKFEDMDFDRYTTVARLSKDLSDKVFSSFGMLYNHYIGGTIEKISDTNTGSTNENHPPSPAIVNQDILTLLKNFAFRPAKGISLSTSLKAEFSSKKGSSTYNRDKTSVPDGVVDAFRNIKSETDGKKIGESINFKYSKIKDVVLFAETDFQQEKIHQYETQVDFGPSPDSDAFTRLTDTNQYDNNYALGLRWYPAAKFNLTLQQKYKQRFRDYDTKEETGDATSGYSAYIDSMDIDSNMPSLRLSYKPFSWFSQGFFYGYNDEIYKVRTAAADATERATYKSNVYSFDTTLSPRDNLYFTLFYQMTKAVTVTNASNSSGATVLPAYHADNDVASLSASYAPNEKTALRAGYSMYMARNFDPDATLLPLGLENFSQDISFSLERKLNKDTSLDLGYTFTDYDENSNGGVDDYEAHLLYAALKASF